MARVPECPRPIIVIIITDGVMESGASLGGPVQAPACPECVIDYSFLAPRWVRNSFACNERACRGEPMYMVS